MMFSGIGLALIALVVAGWVAFALRRAGMALALAGGFAVPVVAIAIYAALGSPNMPDRPLAERKASEPDVAHGQEQADFRRMVATLAERLQNEPGDLEGWTMLARSYRVLGEWGAAASAWARVVEIKGEDVTALDWAELADLRIAAARGLVDARALESAERSLAIDPTLAKSRHFVALGLAQRGQYAEAIERWKALLADAPADATWRDPVATQLAEVEDLLAQQEGRTAPPRLVSPVPPSAGAGDIARPQRGPTAEDMAAARDMSGEDRAAFIQSMVERLAGRLEENPDDPAGWLRLGRAYGVLGRADEAKAALDKAEETAMARLENGGDQAEMQAVLNGVKALRGQ
jgi:cytochrome c-type biogenesis protein CcmH